MCSRIKEVSSADPLCRIHSRFRMSLLRKPLCPGGHDVLINRTSDVPQDCQIFGEGRQSHCTLCQKMPTWALSLATAPGNATCSWTSSTPRSTS